MREALKSLMDNLQIHAMMPCEQITMNRAEVCAMIEDCRAALNAPTRNCDRFYGKTAQEAGEKAVKAWSEEDTNNTSFAGWIFDTAKEAI